MRKKLALKEHIILICGHYEGFDARIEAFVDYEISIGDYVLTGGEIPAMILADSIIRLKDDVIMEESAKTDSLYDGLLKYPQYTKPERTKVIVPESCFLGACEELKIKNHEQVFVPLSNI